MPLYEYECGRCGQRFERLVSISKARQGTDCPNCRSRSVRRLMSVFATVGGKSEASECPTCPTGVCDLPGA
jgi:putative FmdB family regulatory protein